MTILLPETASTDRTDAADCAIEIRDVTKRFRLLNDRKTNLKEIISTRRRLDRHEDFWALQGVSLDIPRGKTFGLIGHNGSGKSTLLKLVAKIHRPTAGRIVAHGRVTAMLELGAGFHPELSGRDNIYLNGSILGMTRKQIDAAIESIIEFSGLQEFIDTPVKVYSSGMYVRLGFAIAVNLEPEILIIDEVIAVGDEEFQRRCFEHLYELRRRGVTIVLVSHSLDIVADLCDEAAWLEGGTLKAVGPARDVVDAYLTSVNKQEAEARLQRDALQHAQESSSLAERDAEDVPEGAQIQSPRRGSGEVSVTSLDLLDADGAPLPFLTTGAPCTIRIGYRAQQDLPSVTFGLMVTSQGGIQLAGPNSGHGDAAFAVQAGEGHVSFHIPSLTLQSGEFAVTTSAVDKGHTYDYLDRAFTLRVRTDDATEPGLVKIPGTWSVTAAVS